MNRRLRNVIWLGGLLASFGCWGGKACKVREDTIPDARGIHAEPTDLLPKMPVSSTGPTRGQAPEQPVRPVGGTTVSNAGGEVTVRIRAHVNGAPILEDELREAMVMRMGELLNAPEARRAELFQELAGRELDRLVERELILLDMFAKIKEIKKPQLLEALKTEGAKEADRRLKDIKTASKVKSDDEFRALLKSQGLSVEGLRRQTERTFMMNEYVRNLIFPTVQRINLQQVREYYEEHPDEFVVPDRVKWQDIFVDVSRFPTPQAARQHAEMIIQRARAGENFAELAKQFDHGDSSLRNGEGLGQKRGDIKPPQAEPVLMSLKAGEVGPVIDLGFGLHIVKVVERDYAGREKFDDKCQARVRKKLEGQVAEREYKKIVADMKRTATVVVYQN